MSSDLDKISHLNEQQVLMLRLLKNPLPEKDFLEMRRLAVRLLAKKVDENNEAWEGQHHHDSEYYNTLSMGHFRSKH